ncbi:MAG: AMP-binding protein [Halieaceae bacterium]|nr:AMP-binding protein [Halieaceae bacterium]
MTESQLTQSLFEADPSVEILDWTVGGMLRDAVSRVPNRMALKEPGAEGRCWTYTQLLDEAERTAAALLSDYDPGDRVAVWAINKAEYVFLQMGAALANIVLVTLNPMARGEELHYLLEQSRVRGLFYDAEFRGLDNHELLTKLLPGLTDLGSTWCFDDWDTFMARGGANTSFPEVDPSDPVLILYTSGTTGKPKGVVLRHRGVVNNGRFGATRYEIESAGVWLNVLPMFHIGGSITMTLGCLSNLGTQVVLPGFDPALMLQSIHDDGVTVTMAVPTMLIAMFEHELFPGIDFSNLEILVTGGTTVPPEIITETKEKMGVDMEVIFGQTEAGGVMAQSKRSDSDERISNTVGMPFPSYSMKIINTESGAIQPTDTIGEICVNSPCMMKEYFDMPEKTAETIDAEGWLHTGDLGLMRTDGYVQITGRLKDMIISGGENIYPREIEDRLITHPDVLEVAVFGVPDNKWGERVVAAVRLEAGATLVGDALMEFLDGTIARHKIPREWIEVDSLPINASGKVQKFILREQYQESQ